MSHCVDSREKFINLEEAPAAKDNLQEVLQNTNQDYLGQSQNNYRRASIAKDNEVVERKKLSRNPSMNRQDAIHVRRLSTEVPTNRLIDVTLDQLNIADDQTAGKNRDSQNRYGKWPSNENKDGARVPLRRSSSSCEHEAYKKEMFDRVNK